MKFTYVSSNLINGAQNVVWFMKKKTSNSSMETNKTLCNSITHTLTRKKVLNEAKKQKNSLFRSLFFFLHCVCFLFSHVWSTAYIK
jgi:hypothetical protein